MRKYLERYRLAGEAFVGLSPYTPHSRESYRRAAWSSLNTARQIAERHPEDADCLRIWLNRVHIFRAMSHRAKPQAEMQRHDPVILGGVSGDRLTAQELGVGKYNKGGL